MYLCSPASVPAIPSLATTPSPVPDTVTTPTWDEDQENRNVATSSVPDFVMRPIMVPEDTAGGFELEKLPVTVSSCCVNVQPFPNEETPPNVRKAQGLIVRL